MTGYLDLFDKTVLCDIATMYVMLRMMHNPVFTDTFVLGMLVNDNAKLAVIHNPVFTDTHRRGSSTDGKGS
jgi:hypothetical protein